MQIGVYHSAKIRNFKQITTGMEALIFFNHTRLLIYPFLFLNITDPTPIPSPTGAGNERERHLLEHGIIFQV